MTPTFAIDTSCVIPWLCAWHTFHARAMREIERRCARGEKLAVSTQVLIEAYAVLTRLPAPYKLSPSDAWTLLETNILRDGKLVALNEDACARMIEELAGEGIGGGQVYDAVISACAVKAKATTLLTFNARHFHPVPSGLEVVVPE